MSDEQDKKTKSSAFSLQSVNSTIVGSVTTLGVIWAFATGVFTFLEDRAQSNRELLLAETTRISELSNNIGLVRYNCAENFEALFAIDENQRHNDPKMKVCYEAFLRLSSLYYPAALTLSKPADESNMVAWDEAWEKLGDAIARAGTVKYDSDAIVCSWSEILSLKNLKLPSLSTDSCN